jgi:hypothetical protein
VVGGALAEVFGGGAAPVAIIGEGFTSAGGSDCCHGFYLDHLLLLHTQLAPTPITPRSHRTPPLLHLIIPTRLPRRRHRIDPPIILRHAAGAPFARTGHLE